MAAHLIMGTQNASISLEELKAFAPKLLETRLDRPLTLDIHTVEVDGDDPRWQTLDEFPDRFAGVSTEYFPVRKGKRIERFVLVPQHDLMTPDVVAAGFRLIKAFVENHSGILSLPDRPLAQEVMNLNPTHGMFGVFDYETPDIISGGRVGNLQQEAITGKRSVSVCGSASFVYHNHGGMKHPDIILRVIGAQNGQQLRLSPISEVTVENLITYGRRLKPTPLVKAEIV